MLSAFIHSIGSYPAMPLAWQLIYHCYVHPGPLVLRTDPIKLPAPTTDRDQTVSRRFEPSSRTTLIGEQPNLGRYFPSRMWWADIEVPNLIVDVNSWIRSACYPQGSFYPLSDGLSTKNRRITKPDFRPCSTCLSRSQAPLCLCTRCMISNHAEGTLGRLRYFLGGDRPSQTARLTLSSSPVREWVRIIAN